MATDIKGGPLYLAEVKDEQVDHPADVTDPDNSLGLADKVEIAAGKKPDTL